MQSRSRAARSRFSLDDGQAQGGLMYKTIMVPTDCSGFDREAIRVALRIAQRSEAKLRLVRVLTTGAYFGAGDGVDEFQRAAASGKRDRATALAAMYARSAECGAE